MIIVHKLVQRAKALFSMLVTLPGIVIVVKPVQLKVPFLMLVILFGMVIEVKFIQL